MLSGLHTLHPLLPVLLDSLKSLDFFLLLCNLGGGEALPLPTSVPVPPLVAEAQQGPGWGPETTLEPQDEALIESLSYELTQGWQKPRSYARAEHVTVLAAVPFLSHLCMLHPLLPVLLCCMKSPDHFHRLCEVGRGKVIPIPTEVQFRALCEEVLRVAKQGAGPSVNLQDQSLLKALAREFAEGKEKVSLPCLSEPVQQAIVQIGDLVTRLSDRRPQTRKRIAKDHEKAEKLAALFQDLD